MKRIAYALGEASNALTLLLFAVLARLLGVEPFGELSAILAATGILGTAVEFGFHTLVTRSVARVAGRARSEVRAALRRQAVMGVPMLLLLFGYLRLAEFSAPAQAAGMLIGLSFWIRALKETLRGLCRGLHRFDLEALFLWTERAALLGLCAGAVLAGGGLVALGLVFLVVRVVDFAAFAWKAARLTADLAEPLPAEAGWRSALPFAVSNLLYIMYYQVDMPLLSLLATARDAGIYAAVYRFVDILQVLPRLLIVVAFPAMALAWVEDRARFQSMLGSLQKLLAAVGLPVLLGMLLWAEELLTLLFGADYAVGGGALRLVVLGNYFAFQSLLLAQAMQSSAHEGALARLLGATVVLNVALNAALIPFWGFLGAAAATAATELVYCGVLLWAARRERLTAADHLGLAELVGAAVLIAIALGAGRVADGYLLAAGILVWLPLLARAVPPVLAARRR